MSVKEFTLVIDGKQSYVFDEKLLSAIEWNGEINYENAKSSTVELIMVKQATLVKLTDFCTYVSDKKNSAELVLGDKFTTWQKQYLNMDIKLLTSLMALTDYLGMPKIYELLKKKFGEFMKGKTLKEIKTLTTHLEEANKLIGY